MMERLHENVYTIKSKKGIGSNGMDLFKAQYKNIRVA